MKVYNTLLKVSRVWKAWENKSLGELICNNFLYISKPIPLFTKSFCQLNIELSLFPLYHLNFNVEDPCLYSLPPRPFSLLPLPYLPSSLTLLSVSERISDVGIERQRLNGGRGGRVGREIVSSVSIWDNSSKNNINEKNKVRERNGNFGISFRHCGRNEFLKEIH